MHVAMRFVPSFEELRFDDARRRIAAPFPPASGGPHVAGSAPAASRDSARTVAPRGHPSKTFLRSSRQARRDRSQMRRASRSTSSCDALVCRASRRPQTPNPVHGRSRHRTSRRQYAMCARGEPPKLPPAHGRTLPAHWSRSSPTARRARRRSPRPARHRVRS